MNTTNENYTIIWEKWKDPLGFDETVENNEYDENNDTEITQTIKKVRCHILTTPLGVIPFNETVPSNDIFNFWTGHTNFAITKRISEIIENTAGIETLSIFTKYRFRISVGKAFADSIVMRQVNTNVYAFLRTNKCL